MRNAVHLSKFNFKTQQEITRHNPYVSLANNDYSEYVITNLNSEKFKARWKRELDTGHPIDLEIGTGNGIHFSTRFHGDKSRDLLGIELKYKPLVQTVRRTIEHQNYTASQKNKFCLIRYNASFIDRLFDIDEISNCFIHFPDPWPKAKHHKHRLIQPEFLEKLFNIQTKDSFLEIKTDHLEYFEMIKTNIENSNYALDYYTNDLQNSKWHSSNIQTYFEKILSNKGFPTHMLRASVG